MFHILGGRIAFGHVHQTPLTIREPEGDQTSHLNLSARLDEPKHTTPCSKENQGFASRVKYCCC